MNFKYYTKRSNLCVRRTRAGQDSSMLAFHGICLRHSQLTLTPGGGIFDWPSFRLVGPTARREDQVFCG